MKIPFFPNTGDGTHCLQAALKMALGYFEPHKEYSYEFLDGISCKKEGMWTWPTAAMLWLAENGYKVQLIEEFDYQKFAGEGLSYIERKYGAEVAKAQAENSDIDEEREIAKKFAKMANVQQRIPSIRDIESLLKQKNIVIVNLNSNALTGSEGYSAHFVVIIDVNKDEVIIHDPGLPPNPNLAVSKKVFEKAWAYPSESSKNVLAIAR